MIKKMTDEGALACGFCGLAVRRPAPDSTFPITPMSELRGEMLIAYRGADIRFTTCSSCAARHAEAARIVAAHPSIRQRFGTGNAQHRLSAALDGCAALGLRVPAGLDADRDLALHVLMTMSAVGNDARWMRQFAPVFIGVGARMSTSVAWSHVTEECRDDARRAYAGVLAFRVAQQQPARNIVCPGGRGCLMCGVGAVTMPATRVVIYGGEEHAQAAVWEPHTISLRTLGGPSTGRTAGHLCPPCEAAVEAVGSIGVAAMARALTTHLRESGRAEAGSLLDGAARRDELTGLAGHAAVERAPSRTPWEHVDLEGISG